MGTLGLEELAGIAGSGGEEYSPGEEQPHDRGAVRKKIGDAAEALAAAIRDYSRSQARFWYQVPHLALEADGRVCSDRGFSTDRNWERAYKTGYWELDGPWAENAGYWSSDVLGRHRGDGDVRHHDVCVDLDSGELVDASSAESPYEPTRSAAAEDILYLAGHLDDLLDAEALVAALTEAAARPEYNRETRGWRAKERGELRRKHLVQEAYFRPPKEVKERPPEPSAPSSVEEYWERYWETHSADYH